jgi:PiT family inorganic phosphate transporter
MESVLGNLSTGSTILLGLALLLALGFEFVNGFHDTANAVATVIYTRSLKPMVAVVWSGTWNFIGVLTSNGAVAYGIIALLPVELIVNVGSSAGFAMVFALLLSAIIWNLGTWYFGLPASSSHTLIGSIVGVGLMNSYLSTTTKFGEGINWPKVSDTVTALLVSPVVGFVCAGALLLLFKALIKNPDLYKSPKGEETPPLWIRSLLVLTCTGVSFAHGSNDGQKGMGLIMLILIGIIPVSYALDMNASPDAVAALVQNAHQASVAATHLPGAARATSMTDVQAQAALSDLLRSGAPDENTAPALARLTGAIDQQVTGVKSLSDIPADARRAVRSNMYLVGSSLAKLLKGDYVKDETDRASLGALRLSLGKATTFIPIWVKAAVAIALGLGTMVGWKRIVVTVGEKIGKVHLTYAQGAAAELVAMATIEAADVFGLPVSTTHVLSSGIAGTMFANQSGLQKDTIRNILLAWILTLPVCVFLGATLFAAGLFVVLRLFS